MLKVISLILTVLITVFCTVALAGCAGADENYYDEPQYITGDVIESVDGTDADSSENIEAGEGEEADNSKSLAIPISALTTSAKFFGITVDGTYMEVIAFKSGSTYRTAFNTCQICYGSRTAYYKQSGSYLVCQNCGSKFALSNVGTKVSSYNCCPYPILETDRTTDGENIIIPYSFLVNTKKLFSFWKVS